MRWSAGSCINPPPPNASPEEIVNYCHSNALTVMETMAYFLFVCHTFVSKRTIERIKRRLSLRSYRNESPIREIINKIMDLQMNGYGDLGYKSMWHILNTQIGIRVTEKHIRLIMRALSNQVINPHRRALHRRQYINPGPNYTVHVDGYDKLKPYGIAIHGGICGFSRKILWMKAAYSNNDPKIIVAYYVEFIKRYSRIPRLVRADRGTENSILRDLQMTLRYNHTDDMAGLWSFQYGRSTANQRIEMIWSFLSKFFTNYWRNVFCDLIDDGSFDNTNNIHREVLRYCFMHLVQAHLNTFVTYWNSHRIRRQRNRHGYFGIPNVMYQQPMAYGCKGGFRGGAYSEEHLRNTWFRGTPSHCNIALINRPKL